VAAFDEIRLSTKDARLIHVARTSAHHYLQALVYNAMMKFPRLTELFVSVLFGMFIAQLTNTHLAGVAFVIAFTLIAFMWPAIGVLVLILSTSSFMYHDALTIAMAGGHKLSPSDVILVILMLSYAFRRALNFRYGILSSPITVPYVTMLLVVFLAALHSMLQFGIKPGIILAAARGYIYYAFFFAVLGLIYERKHVRFLMQAVLGIGILVSLLMIAQFLIGPGTRIFLGGSSALRLEFSGSYVRLLPPGIVVLMVSLFYSISYVSFTNRLRDRRAMLIIASICSLGLVMSLTRMVWMGCVVSVALSAIFFHKITRMKLVTFPLSIVASLLAVMVLSYMCLWAIGHQRSEMLQHITERFLSVLQMEEYQRGSSLDYRRLEYEDMKPYLKRHFLFGFGFGNSYRFFWNPETQKYNRPSFYVHNSALAILLPMGIGGLTTFFWLIVSVLRYCTRKLYQIDDPFAKSLLMATFLTISALIVACMTEPTFSTPDRSLPIALLCGLTVITARQAEYAKMSRSWTNPGTPPQPVAA
jgi:hypothetical protein